MTDDVTAAVVEHEQELARQSAQAFLGTQPGVELGRDRPQVHPASRQSGLRRAHDVPDQLMTAGRQQARSFDRRERLGRQRSPAPREGAHLQIRTYCHVNTAIAVLFGDV